MEKKVFILGQPRSGTTLLQRLLNAVNDVTIYGEHLGILKGIAASYRDLVQHPASANYFCDDKSTLMQRLKDPNVFAPTASGLSKRRLNRLIKDCLDQLTDPLEVRSGTTGFKEIRYCTTDDYVPEMLFHFYPESQLILVIRDPVHQITHTLRQGWWHFTFEECVNNWNGQAANFERVAHQFPTRSRLITFEKIAFGPSSFHRAMFDWLGFRWTGVHESILRDLGKVGASKNGPPLESALTNTIQASCSRKFSELAGSPYCNCFSR